MENTNIEFIIRKAVTPLEETINTLLKQLELMQSQMLIPANNIPQVDKKYITKEQLEEIYGIKQSMQAKLRMDKVNGLPYVRPAGSKIVLYSVAEVNEWMKSWQAG